MAGWTAHKSRRPCSRHARQICTKALRFSARTAASWSGKLSTGLSSCKTCRMERTPKVTSFNFDTSLVHIAREMPSSMAETPRPWNSAHGPCMSWPVSPAAIRTAQLASSKELGTDGPQNSVCVVLECRKACNNRARCIGARKDRSAASHSFESLTPGKSGRDREISCISITFSSFSSDTDHRSERTTAVHSGVKLCMPSCSLPAGKLLQALDVARSEYTRGNSYCTPRNAWLYAHSCASQLVCCTASMAGH